MKRKFTYSIVAVITIFLIASFAFKNDDPLTELTKRVGTLEKQVSSLKTTIATQKGELDGLETTVTNQGDELNKKVSEALLKSLPVGSVVAFAREANYIPAGWVICDGSTITDASSVYYNHKVPNLVSYFIRGKGKDESLFAKGGSDVIQGHSHSIPNHKHTVDGHTHTFTTDEGKGGSWSTTINYVSLDRAIPNGDAFTNHSQKVMWIDDYGQYNGSHAHSGTTNNSSWQYTSEAGAGYTGTSSSETNIPEYIALNYIIKIK